MVYLIKIPIYINNKFQSILIKIPIYIDNKFQSILIINSNLHEIKIPIYMKVKFQFTWN